jgi:rubrerythrin
MSLLLTFMELDKLYESTMSRQNLIDHIRASGRNYNFNNKSTAQLFRIWERIQKEEISKVDTAEPEPTAVNSHATCAECGTLLTDGGLCPVCDDGEEYY